ncbi:TAP-like protein-domain-containing protein [Parachaetomium inaequale]|uniref:TAP-like protein-domain-containing protein n=1 Tax=Parachaetomium inaequale TaxID=2588326 RepID=A0AAN6SSP4_9PEZI|nr:TAP-like protein-domain-containing protein [Parachaetomium inaequale]
MLPITLVFAVGVVASKCSNLPHPPPEGLTWGSCPPTNNPDNVTIDCTTLKVLLDYADKKSNEQLTLNLVRYPATAEKKLGTVLTNFGGPGQEGLPNMPIYGPLLSPILKGQYDIVSWDPRGTGQTLRFQCVPPENITQILGSNGANASATAAEELWAEAAAAAELCFTKNKDHGHLIGQAYSARDMDRIVDALGGDKLKYWGLSGGTVLGAVYGALFPERVGSVLLDGVLNAHEYYGKTGEDESYAAADRAVRGFLEGRLAFPDRCAFYRTDRTVDQLEVELFNFLQNLKTNPIPILVPGSEEPAGFLRYWDVLSIFYLGMYRPGQFIDIATALDGLMQGNLTAAIEALTPAPATPNPDVVPPAPEAILGIRCGDKKPRGNSLDGMRPTYLDFEATTRWFLDFWGHSNHFACAQWKFDASERYEGNFNVETTNPILFLGNTYDPVTPFESAKNMSESFVNGALLHLNGFGHLSLSDESDCVNDAIYNFFVNGEYPEEGTICQPNLPIFHPDRKEIFG